MTSHSNTPSDALKMEQVITESFAKTLHIVLEARSPSPSSCRSSDQALSSPSSSTASFSSVRPRDKWFNLALKECPTSLESLDLWRQSNLEFLVVDILLLHKKLDWKNGSPSPKNPFGVGRISNQDEVHAYDKSEKVIERWIVQYEKKNDGELGFTGKRLINTLQNSYKKLVILLRSLYTTLRLLPANKLVQEFESSGEIREFKVTHRVSSFVEPFTHKEEDEMLEFSFSPVLTLGGRFSLSVRYRSSLSDLCIDSSPSLSPKVIPNYVGSPLAHPLKRFPSLPAPLFSRTHYVRRHSWSFNRFRALSPSSSLLPSPEPSKPRSFPPNFAGELFPSRSPYSNILRSGRAPMGSTIAKQQSMPSNFPPAQLEGKGLLVGEGSDSQNRIAMRKRCDYEEEFSCPFNVDEEAGDEELVGGVKSEYAAVGELVNTLKGTTPLDAGGPKTRTDALKEFCGYKEIGRTLYSARRKMQSSSLTTPIKETH